MVKYAIKAVIYKSLGPPITTDIDVAKKVSKYIAIDIDISKKN